MNFPLTWRFFFISNVHRACMLLWKRFTIFPRNLSCQRSYFRWKLVGLIFLRFPGWKWKICRDQSRLTALAATPHTLVLQFSPALQREPARRLACSKMNFFFSINFIIFPRPIFLPSTVRSFLLSWWSFKLAHIACRTLNKQKEVGKKNKFKFSRSNYTLNYNRTSVSNFETWHVMTALHFGYRQTSVFSTNFD